MQTHDYLCLNVFIAINSLFRLMPLSLLEPMLEPRRSPGLGQTTDPLVLDVSTWRADESLDNLKE